jgi:hypothetical protein
MSATQVIEEIKALPADELEKVVAFCRTLGVREASSGTVAYVNREEAMQVLEQVFDKNEDLFRKLAQ